MSIEEVIEQARRYHPAVAVEGIDLPAPSPMLDHAEAPARETMLWQGAPVRQRVVSRVIRRVLVRVAATVAVVLVVLSTIGTIGAPDFVFMILFLLAAPALIEAVNAWRAIRTAQATSYALTDRHLISETDGQRHERRLSDLPELTLSMEGDGIGTIRTRAQPPAAPAWLAALWPIRPASEVLLESVPDAARVFELLRAEPRDEDAG